MKRRKTYASYLLIVLMILLFTLLSNIIYAQTQSFTATDDAMIYQSGISNNYGSSNDLLVKIQSGQSRYSYIKFNLNSLNLAAIGKAVVRVYCRAKVSSNINNEINLVYVSDNTWQEGTLNWTNSPTRFNIIATNVITVVGKYYEWDVTSFLKSLNLLNSSDRILSFALADATTSNNTVTFNAKEASAGSTAPQLVINENPDLPKTYYIDANGGNDSQDGLSPQSAWQSLAQVNSVYLSPDSKLLFKAGSSWIGQLTPKGSGELNKPIIIDQYGTGPKPIINGNGIIASGVIKLFNQSFWEINNLEITNDAIDIAERRGVEISGSNFGLLEHIHLKNLIIHDVKGTVGNDLADKKSAGIYFTVVNDDIKDTRYDDILVANCEIYNIQNQGIVTSHDITVADYPGTTDWLRRRITNLVIRNNTIHHISKNAMIIRLTDGGLVEQNLCYETATGTTGNTIFSRSARNTVFQYNEGYLNRSPDFDGSLYDPDLNSPGTIWQYSYSHDNAHGLLWLCTSLADTGVVARYNISQNDKGVLVYCNFAFSDAKIYNNTFYIGANLSPTIIKENGNYNHTYAFHNNIIYNANTASVSNAKFSFVSVGIQNRTITDNIFYRTNTPPEINFISNVTSDPLFVDPGKATIGLNTVGGYKLKSGSPALGSGKVMPHNGGKDYFGIAVSRTNKPHIGFYNGPATTVANVNPNFHIYLLTGQSNMSGRGTLATNVDATNPRIKILQQNGTWVTATHPLHAEVEPTAAAVGPGLAFALKMLENADPNVTIGLIPTAVGGQSITVFEPGVINTRTNKSIYDESVNYANIARTQGVLKGVLFHQGESNNGSTSTWLSGVKNLINNFRTAFNNSQLPFIIGEMGRFPTAPDKYNNILSVMPQIINEVPYTALVSSAGLTDIGDDTHFNSSSATTLGIRYATAMKTLFNTLPIKLEFFHARKNANGALLTWKTLTEENNHYFTIERAINGTSFSTIGKINGFGNSNTPITYSFKDSNPNKGINYYRLVQYDINGESTAYAPVYLNFNEMAPSSEAFSIYPNPVKDKVFIRLKLDTRQVLNMTIYDLKGQELRSVNFKNEEQTDEDVSDLKQGVYLLRVTEKNTGKVLGITKFIKE
jgi:hypothetical protein